MKAPKYQRHDMLNAALQAGVDNLDDPIDRLEFSQQTVTVWAGVRSVSFHCSYGGDVSRDGVAMPGSGHWRAVLVDDGQPTVKPAKSVLATAWRRVMRGLHLAACLVVASATLGSHAASASDSDVPRAIPAKVGQAWLEARTTWTIEAMFGHFVLSRDDAAHPFSSDVTFVAASKPKLLHIRDTPAGHIAREEVWRYTPALTGHVIDLPQAVATARGAGMKGELLTAELMIWIPHNNDIAVQIWRLVPDDDPNIEDPNDPAMKNYRIDAVTGVLYAPTNPDPAALAQGRARLAEGINADMMGMFGAMRAAKP